MLIIVAYICSAKRFLYLYSGLSLFVASLISEILYNGLSKFLVTRRTDKDNVVGLDERVAAPTTTPTITCYTPPGSTMIPSSLIIHSIKSYITFY